MKRVRRYTTGITAAGSTATDADQNSSSAPGKNWLFEPGPETLCSSGAGSATPAGNKASTVPSSETKARTEQVSLSDRLTQSLITAGLVCGTIPSSMRDVSGQQTLDAVLRPQGGGSVVGQKAG